MSNVPQDLKYAESHEWLRVEGENATVGISDHAQAELTDIVYVELPAVGAVAEAGKAVEARNHCGSCGTVVSTHVP